MLAVLLCFRRSSKIFSWGLGRPISSRHSHHVIFAIFGEPSSRSHRRDKAYVFLFLPTTFLSKQAFHEAGFPSSIFCHVCQWVSEVPRLSPVARGDYLLGPCFPWTAQRSGFLPLLQTWHVLWRLRTFAAQAKAGFMFTEIGPANQHSGVCWGFISVT